jgi:hypothetical protein
MAAIPFVDQFFDQSYERFSGVQVFFSWRGGFQGVDKLRAGVVAEQ